MKREERIQFRVTPTSRRLIEAAADAEEVSLSEFQRRAAIDRARARILAESKKELMKGRLTG